MIEFFSNRDPSNGAINSPPHLPADVEVLCHAGGGGGFPIDFIINLILI